MLDALRVRVQYRQYKRLIRTAKELEQRFESCPSEFACNFATYRHTLDSAIKLGRDILRSPPKRLRPSAFLRRVKVLKKHAFTPRSASAAYETLIREAQIAGCELFPISGTLLGFIRENDFLKHDYDLDLGIMNDADPHSFATLVQNLSTNTEVRSVRTQSATNALAALNPEFRAASTIPLKTEIVFSSGVVAEIMNHVRHGSFLFHGSRKNLWRNSPFLLLRDHPKGRGAWLPDNCDAYLTENYGDWRVPKVDYIYFLDTPNWVPVVSVASLDYFVRSGIKYASSKPSQCLRVRDETLPRFADRLNFVENSMPSVV